MHYDELLYIIYKTKHVRRRRRTCTHSTNDNAAARTSLCNLCYILHLGTYSGYYESGDVGTMYVLHHENNTSMDQSQSNANSAPAGSSRPTKNRKDDYLDIGESTADTAANVDTTRYLHTPSIIPRVCFLAKDFPMRVNGMHGMVVVVVVVRWCVSNLCMNVLHMM